MFPLGDIMSVLGVDFETISTITSVLVSRLSQFRTLNQYTKIYVVGSVTNTFPLGDCVSLYKPAAGIPPTLGKVSRI